MFKTDAALGVTTTARELFADRPVAFRAGKAELRLDAEAVAVLDLAP